jgi:tetratricopeptide (TPR) repeat protein
MSDYANTYEQDPDWTKILDEFQKGNWATAHNMLDELLKKYPLQRELREFQKEMKVRARIDEDEIQDTYEERRTRTRKITTRVIVGIAVVGLLVYGAYSLSGFFQVLIENARGRAAQELETIALASKFRDAQNLLQSGRAEDALALFNEIAVEDPEYPNLDVFRQEAATAIALDTQYDEAIFEIENGNFDTALALLKDLNEKSPDFRDVLLRIEQIGQLQTMSTWFEEATTAFDERRWADAATDFEQIRLTDINYKTDEVEEKLFTSYINAAQGVLAQVEIGGLEDNLAGLELASGYFEKALALRPQDPAALETREQIRQTVRDKLVENYVAAAISAITDQEDSLAALGIAEFYFGKALALKPQDGALRQQFDFVNKFLSAQDNFFASNWSTVITDLEIVFTEEPDFANGAARQTLYDAYIQRGNLALTLGEYENAIADFRRAAEVAQSSSEGTLLVYEAQINLAYSLGLLRGYEEAVILYQEALTLLRQSDQNPGADFWESVAGAESLARDGNYSAAYIQFREALNRGNQFYDNFIVHVVQEDDYLSQIALLYGTTVQAIVRLNDITDPNRIFEGQELFIPTLP